MQQFRDTDNNSENLNEVNISSINQHVPQFPPKKAPSFSMEGPQILLLLLQFRCAQGNARMELECQLIKRLVNIKKNYEPVCYRLNGTWALKYTNYLYENSNNLPGPIDNTPLLQIKESVCNRDYFILTDTVWKFLLEEYGGGPELLEDKVLPSQEKSADISMISSVQQQELPSDISIKGLKNELFFCYMHSILQCLMCIQELNHLILNKNVILSMLQRDAITKSDYIKINNLRTMISKKFNSKYQHDAQEFLLYLIMVMKDEVIQINKEFKRKQQPTLENVVKKYLKDRQQVSQFVRIANINLQSQKSF